MRLPEVLDRTLDALSHANRQNRELLRMLAEKDAEIQKLENTILAMREESV